MTAVAVTGGAGQLGTLVLRRLVEDESVSRILCLDVSPPSLVLGGKLEYVKTDVRNGDFATLLEGIDAVFHFAFIVTSKVEPALFDAVNVDGTRRVFTGAAEAGVKQMVYASSIAAYGVVDGHPEPIVESTPRVDQPEFPYASAKFRVEAWLDEFETSHPNVAIGRLRPAILVGTHFQNPGAKMLGRLLDGGRIAAVGEDRPMPLVWDEDVADAAITIMKTGARGAFNLTADEQRPAAELAAATGLRFIHPPVVLMKAIGLAGPIFEALGVSEAVDPSWQREGGARMILSSAHAVETLDWQRKCPTCIDVIRHYRAHAPGRTDPRIREFMETAQVAAPNGVDGRLHVALTGPGGGDWQVETDSGSLRIRPGIPRPPDSVLTMSAAHFSKMLDGASSKALHDSTEVHIDGSDAARTALEALLATGGTSRDRPFGGRRLRSLRRWLRRSR